MPSISVVIATYHRPAALRQALRSVLGQTLADWEVIVVGDACTDGTAAVVEAFRESRFRFHNLERGCGDQSGPNNTGVALARARHVAFLNHDDLWFPDHLEKSLATLKAREADLVFCLGASMRIDGAADLLAAVPGEAYDPRVMVPASCWLFERSLAERVGSWRRGRELFNVPSQDWLFRAHLAGARLLSTGHLGVVAVQSEYRPGCYLQAEAPEQEQLLLRLTDAAWREQLLQRCAAEMAGRAATASLRRHLSGLVVASLASVASTFGIHPASLRHALRFGRKGARIRQLRRLRGLQADSPS